MTLEEYKSALALAQGDIAKLRDENNRFRLMLLTPELEPDTLFLAQKKISEAARPIEDLMMFLELHEAHVKLYSELVHTKMTKVQITEHVKEREQRKLTKAREYREAKNVPIEQRVERKMLSLEEAKIEKAVKSLAKSLKITYDAARVMIAGMEIKK